MALGTELVPSGYLHARQTGTVTAGAGNGQVTAPGANLLLKVLLPFAPEVHNKPGFQDQCYILAKPLDANITAVSLDAQQFEDSNAGIILRLRVDVGALPAGLQLEINADHSMTR